MKLYILAALSIGVLVSSGAVQDESRKDLDRMQGTWQAVSLIDDGKPAPTDHIKGARFTVKGNRYELTGAEQNYRGTLTLDAAQKPRAIEATFVETDGSHKGKAHGVYEFDGDRLKISWRQASGERPRTFASTPGSKIRAMVFQQAR